MRSRGLAGREGLALVVGRQDLAGEHGGVRLLLGRADQGVQESDITERCPEQHGEHGQGGAGPGAVGSEPAADQAAVGTALGQHFEHPGEHPGDDQKDGDDQDADEDHGVRG